MDEAGNIVIVADARQMRNCGAAYGSLMSASACESAGRVWADEFGNRPGDGHELAPFVAHSRDGIDEPSSVRMRRVGEYVVCRGRLDDLPCIHHGHPITDAFDER